MAEIAKLTNLDGDTLYPQTTTDAIFLTGDTEDKVLTTKLSDIDEQISRLHDTFDIVIPADEWIETGSTEDADMKRDDYIYACKVSVIGMSETLNPKLFTNYISTSHEGKINEERALVLIKDIYTFNGHIVAFAYQRPLTDVRIRLAL